MKPWFIAGLGLLTFLAGSARQADAAWNNVFQVTCFGCQQPQTARYLAVPTPVVAQSAPGCCAPQPSCTTRYIQRSYYQPVTVMQSKSYYEPVTSYQTSYYYEPVTSYRYSAYYDACSCSYQQVATPVTGYELRTKSCPVQSWVQRCAQVPVTTYQQSFYWEPQTTCCNTSIGAPVPVVPAVPVAPVGPPIPPAPSVTEQRTSTVPPPMVDQKTTGQAFDRYYPPETGSLQPQALPRSLPQQQAPQFKPVQPAAPPAVRLDSIVFAPETHVEGLVVRDDRLPTPGAKVLFVNAHRQATQQEVTANGAGRFQAELAAGDWLVYVSGPDGRHVYSRKIAVNGGNATPLTLVSR